MRKIRATHAEHGLSAVTTFPAGCIPQVPVSDRRYYPIYQTCIDLDIPIISNAGIPGPRVPAECQNVMHFDQVCYDFPELRIVMRHGAEPWEELAVKLMLKWPGLYYMPSAFAPKYYPEAIIRYANSRGRDKVMYAGYYPAGLTLERIFTEMRNVPLKDEVWPLFLRENAKRVFKMDARLMPTAVVTGAGQGLGRGRRRSGSPPTASTSCASTSRATRPGRRPSSWAAPPSSATSPTATPCWPWPSRCRSARRW